MTKVIGIVSYKEIKDEDKLAAYAKIAPATVAKFGGRFIARGYPVALRESGANERTVVVIWERLKDAQEWYDSPDYQACLDVLGDGAVRDMRFVEHL